MVILIRPVVKTMNKDNSKEKKALSDRVTAYIYSRDDLDLMRLTVKGLADIFGVNRSHLSRMVRRDLGLKVEKMLKNEQMLRAAHILQLPENEHVTIKKISDDLGFSRSDHFIRLFRRYYHLTPVQYRESKKEKRRRETLEALKTDKS